MVVKPIPSCGREKAGHFTHHSPSTWLAVSCPGAALTLPLSYLGFPGGSDGKESACNAEDLGLIPGFKDPLEKGMATHFSILAWRIPWTEEFSYLDFAQNLRSD